MENKQKVLIVHNYYQIPGGEDTVVANEKKLLEEHGHQVILYTRSNSEMKAMGKLKKLLLPFITIYNPRTAKDIRRIIKEQQVDIVHVHNTLFFVSPAVYYAALKRNIPVVQTIHNFRLLCPGATFFRDGHICEDCVKKGLGCAVKHGCYRESRLETLAIVFSLMFHRAMGIYRKIYYIALTEFNKQKLLQLQQIKPENVYIKPNFTYNGTVVREPIAGRYLVIGRIEKIKGIDLLIEAFAKMPQRELRIAGNGKNIEKYQEAAPDNLTFLGFLNREQLDQEFSKCSAVIVASQCYETFGMIVIEAFSRHTPVIAGDLANIGALVDDGLNGVKFQYDSSDSLIKAIDRFEKANIREMGEAAYETFLSKYSKETNYMEMQNIFFSVAEKNASLRHGGQRNENTDFYGKGA